MNAQTANYEPPGGGYPDEDSPPEDNDSFLLGGDVPPGRSTAVIVGPGSSEANPTAPVPDSLEDDDDIIDYFLENNQDWVVCEFYLQGHCRYGDSCRNMHPASMAPRDSKKPTDGADFEGDEDCVICLEPVLRKGDRFGILESCPHAFCLSCIRDWRATYDKKVAKTHYRTCPICRENSYLVIPSTRMIRDGALKDELVAEYTAALAEIPCRHFNQGKAYCPFQNSCFYAHYLENGEWYEYPFKRTYLDADGVMHEENEEAEAQQSTLADRLGGAI